MRRQELLKRYFL